MEEKKYQKNIWNKVFIVAGIIFVCFMIISIYKRVSRQQLEKQLLEEQMKQLSEFSNRSSFIAIDVSYQDTIYRIVTRDEISYLKEKYREIFIHVLNKKDTLDIDSLTNELLKTKMVNPQYRIDSVYRGDIDNLVSVFLDGRGVVSDSLSCEETKYLIDILFQNNILINIDCETGVLYRE